MRGYGYGAAAATPAPVPYDKQTDDFLIGIINRYGARLREIHNRLEDKTLSEKEKTDLLAEQRKLIDSYWTPAKTNLEKRGYKIAIDKSQAIIITAPGKSPVVTLPGTKSNMMPILLLGAAAAGAYWYFVMRKKSAGLSALMS